MGNKLNNNSLKLNDMKVFYTQNGGIIVSINCPECGHDKGEPVRYPFTIAECIECNHPCDVDEGERGTE